MTTTVPIGGLIVFAGGALLVYSGLTGKPVVDSLRSVLSGQSPGPVTDPAAPAATGAAGAPGSPAPANATAAELQAYAQSQFGTYGWAASEMAPLKTLWDHESGWRPTAQNPTSTAFGIAQFLDTTWASTGIGKTPDGHRQIDAGMKYIHARYGTPTNAWAFWQAHNWY